MDFFVSLRNRVWFCCLVLGLFSQILVLNLGDLIIQRHWGFLVVCGSCPCIPFIAGSEGLSNQVLHSSLFQKEKLLWNPCSASSQFPFYLELWEPVCENCHFSLSHVTCLESSAFFSMSFVMVFIYS